MKTETARPTWEDVVFESRNKEYGAYTIRKSYNENVSKASFMALLIAVFIFGVLQIASLMRLEIKIIPPGFKRGELKVLPMVIADQPKQKIIHRKDQPVNRELAVKVVRHDVLDLPPVKPVDNAQTGKDTGISIDVGRIGTDLGTNVVITPVAEPPKILDHPEVMPAYEGGMKAMIRFISKNIHYPAAARTVGQEGVVYVRFVVNNLGQVVDVQVLKGVNAMLDKEAMRVVVLMSKWKPGLQNNIPVNVRMVLPIKFQLEQ